METKHYFVTNSQQFVKDIKAVEKLKNYLDYIEVVFTTIEEVFGQTWKDNKIKIELNNSKGGASYRYKNNIHIVKMGICNRNIQKNYPENLWGCLFHETLHAFMNSIVNNDNKNRDLNNGKDGEPFTRSFQQTVYSELKNKGIMNDKLCEDFFNLHRKGINNDAKELFEYYVKIFSKNNNFSKLISYLKLNNVLFTNKDNFAADINKVEEVLLVS